MATTTLYPDGDGTNSGTVNSVPAGPPYYTTIDEGTSSPNDSDYILMTGTVTVAVTLTDLPTDAVTVTNVTIKIRCNNPSKADTVVSGCRLFKSDQTTALTALASITATTTPTTYSLTPTITGDTDKTSWDGARLLVYTTGTANAAAYLAAQVDVTYSTSAGVTTSTSFLIGV